jgi:hypothetical protein
VDCKDIVTPYRCFRQETWNLAEGQQESCSLVECGAARSGGRTLAAALDTLYYIRPPGGAEAQVKASRYKTFMRKAIPVAKHRTNRTMLELFAVIKSISLLPLLRLTHRIYHPSSPSSTYFIAPLSVLPFSFLCCCSCSLSDFFLIAVTIIMHKLNVVTLAT